MAHKTLIYGTSYDVSGGKAMLDGTVYDIASGKALITNAGYEIKFGRDPIPVIITGGEYRETNPALAYVEYNGMKDMNATIYVVPGESVRIYLRAETGSFYNEMEFTVYGKTYNGTRVSVREKEYYLTVEKPSKITFKNTRDRYYTATITYT